MTVKLVGLDMATQNEKTGLSVAVREKDGYRLTFIGAGQKGRPLTDLLLPYIKEGDQILFCLDAPLGWPEAMSKNLPGHQAGAGLDLKADRLFSRYTDRQVHKRLGKKPMEVGAERIARTALRALAVLEEIRGLYNKELPLAWSLAGFSDWQAIEVYPAALLKTRSLVDGSYKGKKGLRERLRMVRALLKEPEIFFNQDQAQAMVVQDDVFDAYLCLLAGLDFLLARAPGPPKKKLALAKNEGWIWTRSLPTHSPKPDYNLLIPR